MNGIPVAEMSRIYKPARASSDILHPAGTSRVPAEMSHHTRPQLGKIIAACPVQHLYD